MRRVDASMPELAHPSTFREHYLSEKLAWVNDWLVGWLDDGRIKADGAVELKGGPI